MWNNRVTQVIILQSPKKGTPWKFWLDPRFLRNSKSKWTLKWLPLDRGYFKFYFHKGESTLIILCHMYFKFDSQIYHFISSHICIAMYFILIRMSRNSVLLINNPPKKRWRGNFSEILSFPIIPSKNEA